MGWSRKAGDCLDPRKSNICVDGANDRIGVQSAMEEMERLEQKGGASQEELEALAQEVSSKMLLTTWRATRWEVISVSPLTFLTQLTDRSLTYLQGRWSGC